MNSELIPFSTENNNRYFYDPRIREIFIFSEEMYKKREIQCNTNTRPHDVYKSLTGKDVEYQLANIGQITIELTEKCDLNCKYCTYGTLY